VNKKRALTSTVTAAACAAVLLVAPGAQAAKTTIVTTTATISQANDTPRLTVLCPQGNKSHRIPYGGTMFNPNPVGPDGEGIYPHSYERLGVQHGYHVTPVLYDPAPPATPRQVTLQVICGPEIGKLTPPHQTAQVSPGQSKTHTIVCPGKRQLVGGGFQRTDFVGPQQGAPTGGGYVTQNQMIASDTWQVSGTAIGSFGGELTGIAYCRRSKKPLLTTVSATATIPSGQFGSATTPACPGNRSLVWTGFNSDPKGSVFYAGGPINYNQTTTGSAYNRSLAPAMLTVEGYCLRV
jgi:uncharacterized membrane protein YjjB (DUF3815 family)